MWAQGMRCTRGARLQADDLTWVACSLCNMPALPTGRRQHVGAHLNRLAARQRPCRHDTRIRVQQRCKVRAQQPRHRLRTQHQRHDGRRLGQRQVQGLLFCVALVGEERPCACCELVSRLGGVAAGAGLLWRRRGGARSQLQTGARQ